MDIINLGTEQRESHRQLMRHLLNMREKLLFGAAPHARVTPLTRRTLREELVRSLRGYLTCEG